MALLLGLHLLSLIFPILRDEFLVLPSFINKYWCNIKMPRYYFAVLFKSHLYSYYFINVSSVIITVCNNKVYKDRTKYMTILDQFFYRPQQVADVLGISRTEVYKLLNENKITSVKENKKRLITRDSLLRYINHLNSRTRTYELR